jgi:choice-of-anchor B domain-containing protein
VLSLLFLLAISPLILAHDEIGGIGEGGNGQPGNQPLSAMSLTPCVNGSASTFPCSNTDLASFLPLNSIGGGTGNDIWGWTDPLTGKEYALMGRSSGTSFVDISNPQQPVYLGNLPAHSANSTWRGVKVYQNHAFIVSEATGHGMQVFDLRQLRNVAAPPVTFAETAHYSGFGRAHTIAVNEVTGFAYAAGSKDTCAGGLHMVNIQNPQQPVFAGCVDSDGYVHETECVMYHGPDAAYRGREICFNANEDTITIVDVTDKSAPLQLSRTGYAGSGYTHQGWLTDDHAHFLLDDELDEQKFGGHSRTRIWDMSDLDAPLLTGIYEGPSNSIDHNLYVRGQYAFEANYRSGLRILDISNIGAAQLSEAAFFDVYPVDDAAAFNGSWTVYPYFASGTVIVSGIEQGLFMLRPSFPLQTLVEDEEFFVRRHYLDFLNREPDAGGWGYWTSQLAKCGTDKTCIHQRRIGISAAFFIESEFQETGSFVYRFQKSSYAQRPAFQQFISDRNQVVAGNNLETSKQQFAENWVQRPEFLAKYPASLSGPEFVSALLATVQQGSGVDLSSKRQALEDDYALNQSRARIVRAVADDPAFKDAEYNNAFVLMQYFGYLQRDPDEGGYQFWLNVLNNKEPGNYRGMVCSFITSDEYQKRFGGLSVRSNKDCR